MKRLTKSLSRLLLAATLASALVFSTAGVAAASTPGCSTSSHYFCTTVYTTASGWTVTSQTVTLYMNGWGGSGYVHWGVNVNGVWYQKAVTGPYSLLTPGWYGIGPSYATGACYMSGNTIYIYAWWQRVSGPDPGGGYVAMVRLPA
jgi:hypothetical protein